MRINHSVRLSVLGALVALMLLVPVSSFAGVFISVGFGPPALPVYVQPPCPAVGYMWTPGYWSYGPDGYFWVPGTWVLAPQPGLLWTPGYWGWGGSAFIWHGGYWGPTVGFYGGINYGYGYGGVGYGGGYWRHGAFYYNRSVNNVTSIHVTNVYNKTVIVNNNTHVAYNGGQGGIQARATRTEEAAARQKRFEATSMQTRQRTMAASNRQLWASENHGRPAIAATSRPGEFKGKGVVAAREAGAPYKAPANRGTEQPRANNAVPRPGNNAPRPATAERNPGATHNNVPRPPQTAGRENTPRVENTSRPSAAPRPNTMEQRVPRPGSEPRTAAPHSYAQPRPQNTPKPQVQSRPAPRPNERPAANEHRDENRP
ncbi:MAG: hypothetical protein WBM11_14315, partial [Terriglobales bacterium]